MISQKTLMGHSLLSYFGEIKDFRRGQGLRYGLPEALVMITMAIMSGCYRLREIGFFLESNADELRAALGVNWKRMPTFVTVRTILMHIPLEDLSAVFNRWARQRGAITPHEIINLDGKALASTVVEHDNALQSFACVVSAYCQRRGVVIASKNYNNGKCSEVGVVQALIEELDVRGAILTADALHTSKKPSRQSSKAVTTISSASNATAMRSTRH